MSRLVPVVIGRLYVAETFALTQLNRLVIFIPVCPRKILACSWNLACTIKRRF
jgi:hypothetical protein